MGVSKNRGTPKWMVKVMENPMNKWMIWGENSIFVNTQMDLKMFSPEISRSTDGHRGLSLGTACTAGSSRSWLALGQAGSGPCSMDAFKASFLCMEMI